MKHLLPFLLTFLLLGGLGGGISYAQQTPANSLCNEQSGLQWQMNAELDVKEYEVYVANSAGIATANPPVPILVTVPHDPATAVIDNNGNKIVSHTLNSQLAEGPKYFAVKAVDLSGNRSDYSNEPGCEYNVRPGAPLLQLMFTQPKP